MIIHQILVKCKKKNWETIRRTLYRVHYEHYEHLFLYTE